MFDTITGLPVHSLVVHAAVVLWPLGVLGLLAMVLSPRLRRGFGWLTMACLVVGGLAVYVAKESGEKLGHRIGTPHDHAQKADILTILAFVTLLLALAWWALDRRAHRAAVARADALDDGRGTVGAHSGRRARRAAEAAPAAGSGLARLLGLVSALVGLASLVYTVLVGHTGAQAVWAGRLDPTVTVTPSGGASASASGSASGSASSYTMAQVQEHKTASSCWVAISGKAYNLTAWINQHPGGPDKITQLCGTDGTAAFTAQHGEDGPNGKPQQDLAKFVLGPITG